MVSRHRGAKHRQSMANSWAVSACYPQSTFYLLSEVALPYRTTGSLRPIFVPARTSGGSSQLSARLCLYTLRVISTTLERTLRTPSVTFRRRPPQSNYPPDTVLVPDHGTEQPQHYHRVVFQVAAHPELAFQLQSLPPIPYTRQCSVSSG